MLGLVVSLPNVNLDRPLRWAPPDDWRKVTVVESHTAGEPFRLVVDGLDPIPGATMVERRHNAMARIDDLRRALMWEPRGHADMYGGIPGPPVEEDSHISVLFLHNEGFSTMCGHGIIALTTIALETGILPMETPETSVVIDTPAGQVRSWASIEGDRVTGVRFHNVPSFVVGLDRSVDVPGMGSIRYDLAFGGAFYAYVRADDIGLDLDANSATRLIEAGKKIKASVVQAGPLDHPEHAELGFLYGVIFVGDPSDPTHHSRNVCIFADGEVDRSPTGTGVSGRLAIERARDNLELEEPITVESIIGSTFVGSVVEDVEFGGRPAIIPQVEGRAYITGRSELWLDPKDAIGEGFLIR